MRHLIEHLLDLWDTYKSTVFRALKIALVCCAVIWMVWTLAFKRTVYQNLFGIPDKTPLHISRQEIYTDLPQQDPQEVTVSGYDIKIIFLKKYQVTARVGYIDRYSNPLKRWYHNTKDNAHWIYDHVMPQDITVLWAQSAGLNPRIIHEYRVALVQGAHNPAEWNNMHVMAATTQVQKGLDILKAGDIASFEGYLIYWETPLKNGEMMTFKSATKSAEISPQKIGGAESYLCKQLYLTKITFDGYTFE